MAIPPSDIAFVAALCAPGTAAVSATLVAEKVIHARRGRPWRPLRVACLLAPFANVGLYALLGLVLGRGDPRFGPIFLVAGLMAGAVSSAAGLLVGFLGRRLVR